MMTDHSYYAILEGKRVIPTKNVTEWAIWFEKANRVLAKTQVGNSEVSTVFLGIDHSHGGAPIWFETMVFGGASDQFCWRYETYDEAMKGHQDVVDTLKGEDSNGTKIRNSRR